MEEQILDGCLWFNWLPVLPPEQMCQSLKAWTAHACASQAAALCVEVSVWSSVGWDPTLLTQNPLLTGTLTA